MAIQTRECLPASTTSHFPQVTWDRFSNSLKKKENEKEEKKKKKKVIQYIVHYRNYILPAVQGVYAGIIWLLFLIWTLMFGWCVVFGED